MSDEIQWATVERHPMSAAMGDMPAEQFDELVESVRAAGIQRPRVILADGMVLDGWHRVKAALDAAREDELIAEQVDDLGPVEMLRMVLRLNIERRHLTPRLRAHKAIAAVEIMGRLAARGEHSGEGVFTDADIAAMAGVSVRTVQNARRGGGGGGGAAPDPGPTEAERLRDELDAARQQIDDLKLRISVLSEDSAQAGRIVELEAELDDLRATRDDWIRKHGDAVSETKRVKSQVRALRRETRELKAKVAELQDELAGAVAAVTGAAPIAAESPAE